MRQTIIIFGSLSAAILLLFELNKFSLWSSNNASELFIVLSGMLFIGIGFLINRFFSDSSNGLKNRKARQSNLSKQERRVLLLMTDGLSNNEIGERLFISESTVKTHVSNILSKLHAKRRTEAIKIGRELNIV